MNRWKVWILGTLVAIALAAAAPDPASAQTRVEVRAAIQATETVLEEAEQLVEERRCERGITLVQRARELQEAARGASSIDSREGLRATYARTRAAMNLAREAVQACKVETQAVDQVRSLIESTRDLASRAQNQLRDRGSSDARRLLDAGMTQLEKAETAYREEQLQVAVSHLTVARKLIERALNQSPASDAASEPILVEAEIARTETFLSELRSAPPAPRRRALYEQAVKNQSRARSALADGRPAQALEFTLAARRLATDLLRDDTAGADGSRVARAIEIVENSLVSLEPELRETEDSVVLSLLEQTRTALDRAREQLSNERFGPAASSARLAGISLRKAAETAGMR